MKYDYIMTAIFVTLCPIPTLFKARTTEVRIAMIKETVVFGIKPRAVRYTVIIISVEPDVSN
jgi:hypothetical protein